MGNPAPPPRERGRQPPRGRNNSRPEACAARLSRAALAPTKQTSWLGKPWVARRAQRQPTRAVAATRRQPKATPQCAPSAGPSGGGNEAGKPSGGLRKGDPRHGRRVAPGRRRSHQSEGRSRQFGRHPRPGVEGAWPYAPSPPPPSGDRPGTKAGQGRNGRRENPCAAQRQAGNPPPPTPRERGRQPPRGRTTAGPRRAWHAYRELRLLLVL